MKLILGKFTKIFIAVIGGNAIYYSFEDHLPPVFHHHIFAMDWGLVLDFWICVFLWVILTSVTRLKFQRKK